MKRDQLLRMCERMLTIRLFEQEVKRLYRAGEVVGAIHLYIGQEAIAVGVCEALRKDDCVTSTHRGHGHFIAKGGSLKEAMAELMGRETGCSRGFGGSMHMFDLNRGFLGGNGIVGGGVPIGLGAAFSARYRGVDSVAVSFFGEGGANQGTFGECLNLASLWRLPYIAVCENNQYAATTPVAESTAGSIARRAEGYGMTGVAVDGNDCRAVYKAARAAVSRARRGKGPTLIECRSYRVEPHCGIIADQRPEGERETWISDEDPIEIVKKAITGFDAATERRMVRKVERRLEKAIGFARDSVALDPAVMFEEFVD